VKPTLSEDDPRFETLRTLGHAACGVAAVSEAPTTTQNVTAGDCDSRRDEWFATAELISGEAKESLEAGHHISARDGLPIRPEAAPDRVSLLDPCAAAFENRPADCVADDGVYDLGAVATDNLPSSRAESEALLRAESAPQVDAAFVIAENVESPAHAAVLSRPPYSQGEELAEEATELNVSYLSQNPVERSVKLPRPSIRDKHGQTRTQSLRFCSQKVIYFAGFVRRGAKRRSAVKASQGGGKPGQEATGSFTFRNHCANSLFVEVADSIPAARFQTGPNNPEEVYS
jgi:hypothetical protein